MIVLRLLGLVLDLLFAPLRLVLRRRSLSPGTWLTVTIDGPVVDVVAKPRFWELRRSKAVSLHALDETASALIGDARVEGLLVTIRSLSAGMATACALRDVLARVRAAGKRVVVHLPSGGDTKDVLVAAAANTILLGPRAQLAPLGFRTTAHYLKRALDRAGIEPQVFACGEFKSAGETLVREGMSPEQREQLDRLLDAFHETLTSSIARGRGVSDERARAIVDDAPYFGRDAVTCGLADDLAYEDEIPIKLGIDEKRRKRRSWSVDAGAYLAHSRRRLFRRVTSPPLIAVVPVHGTITHAGGRLGELSTDERVARMVRAVRHDRRVKGVVLHVDSPGGSALASDLMHHEIEQLAREKPMVVSMGNVAASGGYYVSAPAACIVAHPTTITGSIGVIAARFSLEPLLARLGIVTDLVEKGRRAALSSMAGPLDDDARSAVQRTLEATYRAFVGIVADGRKMPEADVERAARGRVYTGEDALAVKLVDKLGGFDTALSEVKTRLDERIRERVEVRVVRTPRRPVPPLPDVRSPEPSKAAARLLFELLPPRERAIAELSMSGERVLTLAPIVET